ncbi:MAG: hypothetical protein VB120_04535 [Lachnospiraceae bacterium]|nr:hypothetical protein [Lachnospiraceae bacterium]
MKLAVIGGSGLIGSTTAFMTAEKGVYEEIKLLGRRENRLKSHAMDMEHALMPFSDTKVTVGEAKDLSDCEVIFIAAASSEAGLVSREEGIAANFKIMSDIARDIKKYAPEAITLVVTNPIDAFNYYLYKEIGGERGKRLGFGANDSLRFKWAVAKKFSLEFNKLYGFCIGEHGSTQVPLFSSLKYEGKPLNISEETKKEMKQMLLNWFDEFIGLKSQRSSGWTSAVLASDILSAIATDSGEVIACSIPLCGEYGESEASAGLPVSLSKNGATPLLLPITDEEKTAFSDSVSNIKRQIKLIFED